MEEISFLYDELSGTQRVINLVWPWRYIFEITIISGGTTMVEVMRKDGRHSFFIGIQNIPRTSAVCSCYDFYQLQTQMGGSGVHVFIKLPHLITLANTTSHYFFHQVSFLISRNTPSRQISWQLWLLEQSSRSSLRQRNKTPPTQTRKTVKRLWICICNCHLR